MGEKNTVIEDHICDIIIDEMKEPKKKLKLIHSQKSSEKQTIETITKDLRTIVEKIEKNLDQKNNRNDTTKLSY
jgi:regulator of sirC expression with transglutaminase-like and TPR domain